MSETKQPEMTIEERAALAQRIANTGSDMVTDYLGRIERASRDVSTDRRSQDAACIAFLSRAAATLIATAFITSPPRLRALIMHQIDRASKELIVDLSRELAGSSTGVMAEVASTFRAPGSNANN